MYALGFFLLAKARTTVIGPTLPKYIVIIIITFPTAERYGVNPSVNPTVAKADVTSYRIYSNENPGSVTAKINVPSTTIPKPINKTAKALYTNSFEILFLNTSVSSLPLIIEIRVSTTIPKVAVLIPPAVDPGDPRRNRVKSSSPCGCRSKECIS